MLRTQAVKVRAGLASQVEKMLEALVRHERRARALPLQERIRRDGRAVREPLDRAGSDRPCRRDDGFLLARRGQHLCRRQRAAVEQHRVGERTADVDTEDRHSGRLTA